MVALTFPRLAAAISALVFLGSALAAPAVDARSKPTAAVSNAAPHFVIYSDDFVTGTTPDVSTIQGYNVL